MKALSKTHGQVTWPSLTTREQELLKQLCVPRLVGLWVGKTDAPTRRTADRLLEKRLVRWTDGVLRVEAAGLRLVVEESGLIRKAVG